MSKLKELLILVEDDRQSVDILVKLIRKNLDELDHHVEELSVRFDDGDSHEQKAMFDKLKEIANSVGRLLK